MGEKNVEKEEEEENEVENEGRKSILLSNLNSEHVHVQEYVRNLQYIR